MKQRFFRGLMLLLCLVFSLGVYDTALARNDRQVIPPKYDSAGSFSEGLAAVRVGDWETGKWGFIDRTGSEVIPPKYDAVEAFCEGLALVRLGDYMTGKYGFIDKTGQEVIPLKYDSAGSFREGFARVVLLDENEEKYGFIDATGKEVVPPKYDYADGFQDGLARVGMDNGEDGLWGFVDTTGQEVIPCRYSRIGDSGDWPWWSVDEQPFSEGLAAAWVAGDGTGEEADEAPRKWGVLDETGKAVVPVDLEYDDAGKFHEGLLAVMEIDRKSFLAEVGDGAETDDDEEGDPDDAVTRYAKVGFIDTTGELVIPLLYTCPYYVGNGCLEPGYIMPKFSEGLAAVMNSDFQESKCNLSNNGKFGYIDTEGTVVIPFVYDYAAPFSEGLAYVCLDGKFGFIDTAGEVIVPIAYDCDFYNGCDSEGGRLAEQSFSGGFAFISESDPELGMQYGLVDAAGIVVVPLQYDWIDWDSSETAIIYSGDSFYGDAMGYLLITGGDVVLVDQYEDVGSFSEGFAAVALGEWNAQKWGFIDTAGQEVVPCIYDDADACSEGLAAVKQGEKWGYIAIGQ